MSNLVDNWLPFIVIGTVTGSLYGLAGMGLVLTYRTSGVFNLAHGALAAASAYVFYSLHFTIGWAWPLAALVAVGVFGPIAGLISERLFRSLVATRQATITVSTIGLLLLIQGFLYWHYGPRQLRFPDFLPTRQAFLLSGVSISWVQIINVAVGVLSFVGLVVFLRATRVGKATTAVVADPALLSLTGMNPVPVRRASWIIGCSFAALTGILIAPTLGADAFLLSALVVQAFGAVAIGRFSSLGMTYVGGLVVGILAALAQKQFGAHPPWNGLPSVVPFIVLIAVMLATPSRKLPKGAGRFTGAVMRQSSLPPAARAVLTLAAAGGLIAVPSVVGARLPVYTSALIFSILFLSLSTLTRMSGQISLAHAAFAGVGAATFGHLVGNSGWPWLVGLIAAGLVTGAVGALLALPAMRLSGIYLALATFGFSLLMDNVLFNSSLLFGAVTGTGVGVRGPRPQFGPISADSAHDFYFVVLAVVAVSCLMLLGMRRAQLGRFFRAMADSPTALTTMGLGVNVTRLIAFAVSAFFAGIAGALYIVLIGTATPVSFPATNSLLYLAVLTVAGAFAGYLTSGFLAAALLVIVPSYVSLSPEVQSMLFGVVAVAAALVSDGRVDWAGLKSRFAARVETATQASTALRSRSPLGARRAGEAPAVRTVEGAA
jgi:branched-subunit amino acid ABC-type transport system permease component